MHELLYIEKPNGASYDGIEKIESFYKVALPNSIKEWWLQSDGPIIDFEFKELQFFSVEEMIGDDIYELNKYMPNCIPICLDGNGNICVAKIQDGKIIGFYVASTSNLNWEDSRLISNAFDGFLADKKAPEKYLYF